MTLKQKSLLISLSTNTVFLLVIIAVVYQIITVQFQKLENQRVERNIRRITAILEDRFSQISSKLTDWTNWDDTYHFIQDKNKAYISSNLIPENFKTIGVDEALFIDKNGALVASINSVEVDDRENNFPDDLYSKFSTGSALLKIDKELGYNHGIIRTNDDGILLFTVREILKSDQSGPPMGTIVFARYLDKNVLNSVKELTQFEAIMYLWDDPSIPSDFLDVKEDYKKGIKEHVDTISNSTISGYLVIEDIYGQPQAIVRSDIGRDITLQGKSSMLLLLLLLIGAGLLTAGINYWLLTGSVLQKISLIASDVDSLAKSGTSFTRLKIATTSDEVDKLRQEINNMLDSLQKSKSELSTEKQKGESLIDLINAIVVTLDTEGTIVTLNRKGLDTLGYKQGEVLGKNWFDMFIPKGSKNNISQHFKELISGNLGDNAHLDNEILAKDGKTILVSWQNTLIKDTEGKVVSTLSLGEDVTEEKQEEIKKEAYSKELERLNELMVNRELKMVELKKQLEKDKKA